MPNLTSMFPGMESYLEGDVEINNTVTAPDESGDVAAAETAADSAEVSADVAEASKDAQETETATMLLDRMCTMYQHVKQFGIDRTFVSLYNRHGELDRVCGMSFPSCESMDAVGDRYSRYSQAFIAAMESSKDGLWSKIKAFFKKIWDWIKNVVSKIWDKIKSFIRKIGEKLHLVKRQSRLKGVMISVGSKLKDLVKNTGKWVWNHKFIISSIVAVAGSFTFLYKHMETLCDQIYNMAASQNRSISRNSAGIRDNSARLDAVEGGIDDLEERQSSAASRIDDPEKRQSSDRSRIDDLEVNRIRDKYDAARFKNHVDGISMKVDELTKLVKLQQEFILEIGYNRKKRRGLSDESLAKLRTLADKIKAASNGMAGTESFSDYGYAGYNSYSMISMEDDSSEGSVDAGEVANTAVTIYESVTDKGTSVLERVVNGLRSLWDKIKARIDRIKDGNIPAKIMSFFNKVGSVFQRFIKVITEFVAKIAKVPAALFKSLRSGGDKNDQGDDVSSADLSV